VKFVPLGPILCSMATRGKRAPTREGDIVVTRVGDCYSIGRVTADGDTQTPLMATADRVAALRRACELGGADHQVYVAEDRSSHACVPFHSEMMSGAPRRGVAQATGSSLS